MSKALFIKIIIIIILQLKVNGDDCRKENRHTNTIILMMMVIPIRTIMIEMLKSGEKSEDVMWRKVATKKSIEVLR